MENLTKQQIVLLTLLVSFVTSIATGIITVSLMDQAPAGVTQTVNRVVERTIEKVVQAPSQQATVVTKETVVVKEDDLIVSTIDQNAKSIVRIVPSGALEGSAAAVGLVLSKDGIIAVDSWSLLPDTKYSARFSDGSVYSAQSVFKSSGGNVELLKVSIPETEKETSFSPAKLADSDTVKLGQTVVFISGRDSNAVETGLISTLGYKKPAIGDSATTTSATTTTQSTSAPQVDTIDTNIKGNSSVGGVLTNLSAEVIAFVLHRDTLQFVPSNVIKSLLGDYIVSLAKPASSVKTP